MIEKHFDAIAIKVVEAIILGGPQHVSQIGDLPGIVNEMGSSLIWKFSKSSWKIDVSFYWTIGKLSHPIVLVR